MTARVPIDDSTQQMLADLTECFDAPCIVGAPWLARELMGRNVAVTAFTDEVEFAGLPCFRQWSIAKPVYVPDAFDFVLVAADEAVRPPELFSALRVLSHFHYDTPALIVVPRDTASCFAAALDRFDVEVRETSGEISLIANFDLP